MPKLEKYIDVTCPPQQESGWNRKEKISENEKSRYKLIKLYRDNRTFGKTALAIALTLITLFLILCSSKTNHRFNKYLNNCWLGREVKYFKINETKLMLWEKAQKHCKGMDAALKKTQFDKASAEKALDLARVEEERARNIQAQFEKKENSLNNIFETIDRQKLVAEEVLKTNQENETCCKNLLEALLEKEEKAALMLAASEKVLDAAKFFQIQMANETEAKQHLEALKGKEAELLATIQQAKLEENRIENRLNEITSNLPIFIESNIGHPPFKSELNTLKLLSDICIGERIDVNEKGYVLESAYTNDWTSTAWRTYMQSSAEDLLNLNDVFLKVLKLLCTLKDFDEQKPHFQLMLNAIEGLRTLENDYKQSGKEKQAKIISTVVVKNLEMIKTFLWEKLGYSKGVEFQKYHTIARRFIYLHSMFNRKKEAILINELYSYVRENLTKEEEIIENYLLGCLDQGITSYLHRPDLLNQAGALEASVIASPNGMAVTDTLPFIRRKILLFMALYDGEAKIEMSLWKEFLAQLEQTKQALDYVSQERSSRNFSSNQIKLKLNQLAETYLDSLGKQPKGAGILIPVGYVFVEKGKQSGHFAPVSILKEANEYYLFQHNAGPGALRGYEDNGEALVGCTTVPLGPYTREEAKNFIMRGVELQMTQYLSSEEGVKAYQSLFDRVKIIETESIPKRLFQRIGNCSVRGFIEWIVFANQRFNQIEVVNEFIQFDLFKSRHLHVKSSVESLKYFDFFNRELLSRSVFLKT